MESTSILDRFGHNVGGPLPSINEETSLTGRSFVCPSKKLVIRKLCFGLAGLAGAVTSIYFATQVAKSNDTDNRPLSVTTLSTGVSGALIYYALLPYPIRRIVDPIISGWSYPVILSATQGYLNFPSALFASIFVGTYGFLETKDIITTVTHKRGPYTESYAHDEGIETLPMCGYSTRSKKKWPIIAAGVISVALTTSILIFNHVNFDQKKQFEDNLYKRGFYQDLIAIYSGTILGEFITKVADDLRETYERKYSASKTGEGAQLKCYELCTLRIERYAKRAFLLFVSFATGAIFSIYMDPNTIGDFSVLFTLGAIYGGVQFLDRREFENPNAPYHIREIKTSVDDSTTPPTCLQKVINFAKKFMPSLTFIGGLVAYFIWVATQSSNRSIAGIAVMLVSICTFFAGTHILASNYRPSQDTGCKGRLLNETYFRLVFFAFGLAFYYQYITSAFGLDDVSLNNESSEAFAISLLGWANWGAIVGSDRATAIQDIRPHMLPTTPSIAMQELGNAVYYWLLNNGTT